MTHKRKDTLTTCKEWAKHLKPFGKRTHNKYARLLCLATIRNLKEEAIVDQDFELAATYRDIERGLDSQREFK
jgi:hypothetical protein